MNTVIPITSSRDYDIILGILIGRGMRVITTNTDKIAASTGRPVGAPFGILVAAKYSRRQVEHLFELAEMARCAPANIG